MKGRSPLNKLSIRKTDVYKLLLNLDGEARWKDLEMKLKELGWGPTTLKQVLDEMVEEGSLKKEARLGARGPEAWYAVVIKDDDIWAPLLKSVGTADEIRSNMTRELRDSKEKGKDQISLDELAEIIKEIKDTSIEQVSENIKKRAQQLKGAERGLFLRAQMRKIAQLASEELQSLMYMEAKSCRLSKEKLSHTHFMLSTIFNNHLEEYLKVLNS